MTVKGIFFDMDGVVVDSDPLWNTIIRTVREEYALDMSCLERSDGYNLSTGEAIRLVLEDMGRYSDGLLEEILHRIDILYSLHRDMVSLMPGMAETLEMLHERGVHTALVSNSSCQQVDMVLDRLCLRKYFQTVVTADDVTCGKPDAEPYLRAIELTGLTAADAVAVEDSPTGIAAAVNAGLLCLVPVPADFKSCGTKVHDGICYLRRENLYGKLDNLTSKQMKKIINPWLGLEDQGYNCFGCAPSNKYGLKMEFYEDGDDVVSYWNPSDDYQGWLHTLHGGIQSTLMDEIAMWVIARKLQTSGMTTRMDIKFRKPVPTGPDVRIEIRSHIMEMKRNFAILHACVMHEGTVCSEAEITYFCFPKEKAASDFYFNGCDVE